MISGVAASEPQVQPAASSAYSVRQGGVVVNTPGRALFDYATYAALYQPCIASVAGNAGRCTALVAKGLLNGADLAAQQADAKQRLRAYGWLLDSDPLQAAHAGTNILVAVTYAYAYGKFSVTDKVCGFTFAQTDGGGNPIAFTSALNLAQRIGKLPGDWDFLEGRTVRIEIEDLSAGISFTFAAGRFRAVSGPPEVRFAARAADYLNTLQWKGQPVDRKSVV